MGCGASGQADTVKPLIKSDAEIASQNAKLMSQMGKF